MNRPSRRDGKTETQFVPHSCSNLFNRTETRPLSEVFKALGPPKLADSYIRAKEVVWSTAGGGRGGRQRREMKTNSLETYHNHYMPNSALTLIPSRHIVVVFTHCFLCFSCNPWRERVCVKKCQCIPLRWAQRNVPYADECEASHTIS